MDHANVHGVTLALRGDVQRRGAQPEGRRGSVQIEGITFLDGETRPPVHLRLVRNAHARSPLDALGPAKFPATSPGKCQGLVPCMGKGVNSCAQGAEANRAEASGEGWRAGASIALVQTGFRDSVTAGGSRLGEPAEIAGTRGPGCVEAVPEVKGGRLEDGP